MFYHVRVKHWQSNGYALNVSKDFVEERILKPYQQGTPITLNAREIDVHGASRVQILATQEKVAGGQDSAHLFDDGEIPAENDVTNDFIVGPPGGSHEDPEELSEAQVPSSDTRDVFVVHGRNEQGRDALFAFLRSIGLHPLEWSELVQATGKPTPYVGEVLDAAFSQAHAVIVLFTPDDEARLNAQLWNENEPDYETEFRGQARPNVLFEAGMAMGRNNERTVLVELGRLRRFSDIEGLHVVRLDGSTEQLQELARRLETAGCPVNWDGIDEQSVGDFEAAIESVVRVQSESTDALELKKSEDTHLSEEAKQLLAEATKDEIRFVVKSGPTIDLLIQTNGRVFGESGDVESQAKWEQALTDLIDRGLVRYTNGLDKRFEITQKGIEIAAALGKSE